MCVKNITSKCQNVRLYELIFSYFCTFSSQAYGDGVEDGVDGVSTADIQAPELPRSLGEDIQEDKGEVLPLTATLCCTVQCCVKADVRNCTREDIFSILNNLKDDNLLCFLR